MTDEEELKLLRKEIEQDCGICGSKYRDMLHEDYCCSCLVDELKEHINILRAYLTIIEEHASDRENTKDSWILALAHEALGKKIPEDDRKPTGGAN